MTRRNNPPCTESSERKATVRILISDEYLLPLEAIATAIASTQGFDVVGVISDGTAVIPTALRSKPRVALLGVSSIGHDNLHLVSKLRGQLPSCMVAIMATEPTPALINRAVAAGVLGVIPKRAKLISLIEAIRRVAAGRLAIDPTLLGSQFFDGQVLTSREREILRLTAAGASVKEVAQELYLAPGTVRNITSKAMKKLEGRNRYDAARIALDRGWL